VFGSRLDAIQECKNDPQKNNQKFEGFSCFDVLDVLVGGLEASPAAEKHFREAKE
jgi:hypothetical protein